MVVRPLPTRIQLAQQGRLGTHLRPSPPHTEIPKDLGWGGRSGARNHKVTSAPSPRPGPTLGSGQTQKTSRICADNSAAASICAAQGNRAAGPRGRVPAPAGARSELGASVDAAGALRCAFRAALPSPQQELGAPRSADKEGEAADEN